MDICFTVWKLTSKRRGLWTDVLEGKANCGYLNYVIFQEEKCPKTGNLHLQGYMELSRSFKYNDVKKIFGGEMWLHLRDGTKAEAIKYCKKDATRVPDGLRGEWRSPWL